MIRLSMAVNVGSSFAEDKDVAKNLRQKYILPGLKDGRAICIDFYGIELTTQSFIHALISEAIRKYGDFALERIEFKSCGDIAQSVISTVVEYSYFFYAGKGNEIETSDIPQAADLKKIRNVLFAYAQSKGEPNEIGHITGYSLRHIRYRIKANEILGFIKDGVVVESGIELLGIESGSMEEREYILERIIETNVFQTIVPDLFELSAPSTSVITRRIVEMSGLKESTASSRASCLLSWREYVMNNQLQLML